MDKNEALAVLRDELQKWRVRTYAQLAALMDGPHVVEVAGPSGAHYQIEVEVFWDDTPQGDIRVMGGVDDGGWRAFAPLTDSFIVSPYGGFVGE